MGSPSQKYFARINRSEEHTSELQSRLHLVCRLLLEKKKEHQILSKIINFQTFQTSRRDRLPPRSSPESHTPPAHQMPPRFITSRAPLSTQLCSSHA